ncbi:hypothetical protein JB92DRAFT_2955032 [Gautieria morchelliformis]|nr:hypothetical protein JB92DRAFT_2955032 [Gautieria morchelliformis]
MVRFTATCVFMSLPLLPLLVAAFDVTGRIKWNDICHGYQDIPDARVVLDDGRWFGYVRRDGRFAIPNVDEGTYTLSVVSHDFQFDQLRIDVSTAEPHVSVHAYVPGVPLFPAPPVSFIYPIVLSARARNSYFARREAFNPLDMLKSPMMLMMLVTGGLLFATPYLMANMDQEALSEVKGRQNKLLAAQNSIQNMDIDGLANLLGAESNSTKSSKPTAATASTSGKGKGKARKR